MAQCHINSFKKQRACSVKIAAAVLHALHTKANQEKGAGSQAVCVALWQQAVLQAAWITRTMSVKRVAYQQQLSQLLNIYNNRVFIAVAM